MITETPKANATHEQNDAVYSLADDSTPETELAGDSVLIEAEIPSPLMERLERHCENENCDLDPFVTSVPRIPTDTRPAARGIPYHLIKVEHETPEETAC